MLAFVSKTKDYIILCQIWLKFYRIFLNSFYDSSLNKISSIFGLSKHLLVLKTSCKYVLKTSWKTKHCYAEDVLKTSWRHVLNTSWRHVLKMSWRLVLKTCLEDVLKTCLEDVLETCLEDVLKTCVDDVLKMSWRQTKCLLGISLSDKSKSVSDKSTSHISIFDKSSRIQNALIRTQ